MSKVKDQVRFVSDDAAVRRCGEELSIETFVEAKEGQPIPEGAELVHLAPEDKEGWRDVTSIYKNGPAQVATPEYRENYDRIFGKKQKVGIA